MTQLSNFNIRTPTLGGRQVWGDMHFFRGYRIQHNLLTGHNRLLDPHDFRLTWGTRVQCLAALEQVKVDRHLLPMTGTAVILVHGIFRSSKSFCVLEKKLRQTDVQVVGFDYPSTRVSLPESAEYLRQVIDSLTGITRIQFVVHSMGGLLVRTYLQQTGASDTRLHRMVMLGVPNRGARMASLLKQNLLFRWTYGPAGQQLVDEPTGYPLHLPVPAFPFAIVAGVRETPTGWNPLIPGDDDGTVSVEATRLPGAADFIKIRTCHSTMMWNPQVISATINFLQTGAFRSDGTICPLGTDAMAATP